MLAVFVQEARWKSEIDQVDFLRVVPSYQNILQLDVIVQEAQFVQTLNPLHLYMALIHQACVSELFLVRIITQQE